MYFHFHKCWYGGSGAPDSKITEKELQRAHTAFQTLADHMPFLLCILAPSQADSFFFF